MTSFGQNKNEIKAEKLSGAEKVVVEKLSKVEKVFGALFLLSGILLLLPPLHSLLIFLAENILLHRALANHPKWIRLMFLNGGFCALFGIIIFARVSSAFLAAIKNLEKPRLLFILCAACSAVLLVFPFLSADIWYDEAFSLALVKHSFSDVLRLTNLDVHPPLYYFILKIFHVVFGGSVYAAKLASAVPSVLLLFFASRFLLKNFSFSSAVLFLLLFMASEGCAYYSYEIRMYSWAAFFIVLCSLVSYKMIFDGGKRYFLLYGIFAACAAYTQHYAAVAMIFHIALTFLFLLILDCKNIKKILITVAAGLVLYLPQIPVVIGQFSAVSKDYWIGPVTFSTLVSYGTELFSCGRRVFIGSALLMVLAFFFGIEILSKSVRERALLKTEESKKSVFALIQGLSPLCLIAFGLAVSLIVRPVFTDRYIVPAIPLMLIFICIAAEKYLSPSKKAKLATAALFCCVLNLAVLFRAERFSSKHFKEFSSVLNQKVSDETQFVYPDEESFTHFRGVLSVLYPKNEHFADKIKFTQEVFGAPWKPLEEAESGKEACIVMSEEFFEEHKSEFSACQIDFISPCRQYHPHVFAWSEK